MTELLHAAVSPPNLLPTSLLVFVLLYWLTVLLGVLDVKTIDVDTDHAAHFGPDGPDAAGMDVSWLNYALAFLGLGQVPLLVFLSLVALPWWVGSILANYYLGNEALLPGLLLLLPLLGGSLLLARVLVRPFGHLFATLEHNTDDGARPLGKVCTVLLPASHEQLGQASVRLLNGAPLVLNVRTSSAATSLRKGESALVIDYDPLRRCYLIEPYDAP